MVKILRNCDPMDDCKPVVFMSCFLLIFWLLLSYITNSYFAIFLMVSNFILIFGCCVSLSGYVVGQLIDTRRETGQLIEVTTISASQPFVRPPEYPPSYDEAIRYGWQHCRPQNGGGDGVVLRIPLENDPRINPIYMNLPYSAPVENSHLPITYNGMQNIPSYEMSTSSAVTSSPLTLNMISRSTTMSDLENSTTIMERYSNIPSYEMSTSPAVASSPLTLNMASRSTTVGDLENSTAIVQLYPTIPSYGMSTLSASVSSPMTLTGESRSTTVSDLENSTSVMESYSAIQTLTPLTESTTTNSNLENSIILDAYPTPQTLTLFSRSTSVSEIASNLENSSTSPDIMESHPNQISRFCVSESTDLCSKREINIGQKSSCVSKSEAQFEHERHWSMCSEHSSQDLEFQRFSSSLSLRHPISLNRSLSFPDIK